ncbi:MAG: hypothetical protein FD153_1887, partial [Rhodospirillaceae bacterium]
MKQQASFTSVWWRGRTQGNRGGKRKGFLSVCAGQESDIRAQDTTIDHEGIREQEKEARSVGLAVPGHLVWMC